MEVYLGLDLGTTALKGILVDGEGRVRKMLSESLSLQTPQAAWAEQNPAEWLKAAEKLLRGIPQKFKVRRIGLSGQMHSLVPLDADGRVIRPAILWCDQRTSAQCREATKILGGEKKVLGLIGNPILEGFTLGKLLWLREKEPKNFAMMKRFLLPKDYLAFWLTGQMGIDYSDAAGTAAFDVSKGEWSAMVLKKLKLDPALFPAVQNSLETRGRLRPELAKKFGLGEIEIAAGGADNAASALGVGILGLGDVMVSVGTSGTVVAATANAAPEANGRLHYFNHVLPGLRYDMGVMLSASSAVNFFVSKYSVKPDWSKLEKEMRKVAPGCGGLLYLPYLNGERTPHRDSSARGVLCGLSQKSGWPEILRAALEGVSFGLRDSFELIKARGPVKRVFLAGGGAKNKLWAEILAANFHQTLIIPEVDEGGAYGAAMLAALGDGRKLNDVRRWVRPRASVKADSKLAGIYDRWHPEYRALYQDLKPRFARLEELASEGP